MLTLPIGVQERVGNPPQLQPVLPGAWKYFCRKDEADAICIFINQQLGLNLQVIEDGEGPVVFVYTTDDCPRVYSLVGQDAQGNEIYESASWILDRRKKPAFGIDKQVSGPNQGQSPVPKFATMYGIAQFYWEY